MKNLIKISGMALAMTLAACGGETATTNQGGNVAEVDTSQNWAETVSQTPEGGFVMGNPDAPVKVVEYASLTCPACANFSTTGFDPLVENYVSQGLVSFELRNFVLNGLDLGAAVLSRCNGADSYFALTERFFANQPAMMQAAQSADPAELEAIQSLPQAQQMARFAEVAGLIDFVGGLGVPEQRARECLADPEALATLERIRNEGISQHNIPGTPTFLINGEVVQGATTWPALQARIDEELR